MSAQTQCAAIASLGLDQADLDLLHTSCSAGVDPSGEGAESREQQRPPAQRWVHLSHDQSKAASADGSQQ